MKEYSYKNIRKTIENLVKKECKKHSNIYGYDAWSHHIAFVVKFSKMLAKKLKADREIVELAALLHDFGSIKGDYENHHISGTKEAEKILKRLNYPQDKIKKIKHCIYAHRASKSIKRNSVEAECVASADAMSHFKDISSLFSLVFVKYKMNIDEGTEYLKGKIERSWKKLNPEAKKIVENQYKAIKIILK